VEFFYRQLPQWWYFRVWREWYLKTTQSCDARHGGKPAYSVVVDVSFKKTAKLKGVSEMPYVKAGKEHSGDINIYYKDWGLTPTFSRSSSHNALRPQGHRVLAPGIGH
jgi:hypothetical protein